MKKRLVIIFLVLLVFSFSVFSGVWEQYTGVWSGVFANTTEDSDGNIVLDDGNATGSFSSGSFSCLGAGCNWTEIVWENNSVDDKAYGGWTLLDAFDDSSINPALWTTVTSGDGSVTEVADTYVRTYSPTGSVNEMGFNKVNTGSVGTNTIAFVGVGVYEFVWINSTATNVSKDGTFLSVLSGLNETVDYFGFGVSGISGEAFIHTVNNKHNVSLMITIHYIINREIQANYSEEREGESWIEMDVCYSMDNITFDTCQNNLGSTDTLSNETAFFVNWTAYFNRTVVAESGAVLKSVNLTYSVNNMVLHHNSEPTFLDIGDSAVLWANISENAFAETCNFSASHLYDNISQGETENDYSSDMYLINENSTSNKDGVWNITIPEANKTGNIEANISCTNSFGGSQTFNYSIPVGDVTIPELIIDSPSAEEGFTSNTIPVNIYTYDFGEISSALISWGGSGCSSECNSINASMSAWDCINKKSCSSNSSITVNGTAGLPESLGIRIFLADSSGNLNESSVNFTVSIPSPPAVAVGAGGGGGGAGAPKCDADEVYDTRLGICIRRIPENITNLTLMPQLSHTYFPYIPFSKKYRELKYSVRSNWELKSASITKGPKEYNVTVEKNTTALIYKKIEENNFVAKTETVDLQVLDIYGRVARSSHTFTIINVGVYVPLPFKLKTGKFLEPFFAFKKGYLVGIRGVALLMILLIYVVYRKYLKKEDVIPIKVKKFLKSFFKRGA